MSKFFITSKNYNFLSIKLFLLCAALFYSKLSAGLQLDSDGGYHLTIGIQNGQVVGDSQTYVEAIKTGITNLSSLIFKTTDRKFHIKSVNILIPSQWVYEEEDEVAKSHNFAGSDIKISDKYTIPDISRKVQCGHPAEAITLPLNYFEDSTNDVYKAKDKSLLHLWALFRWGVFEESGFPFNSRFPYFHQPIQDEEWKVNACTDEELLGLVQHPDQSNCITDETMPPDSDCRFYPDESQTGVKSSLMTHFHWINSMESFCTNDTHDVTLPNRQNVMCGYQSVTEVMESCPDFLKVNETTEFVEPAFSILKESDKPLLYFLFDSRSITQVPLQQITAMKSALKAMFDVGTGVDDNSLGGVAVFPGRNGEIFEELISWTHIAEKINEFRLSIENISTLDTTVGLFGTAIKSISESIRSREHPAGAFLFIFKSSSGTNFENMPFEQQVMASLIAQNTKVYAVEVSNGPLDPGMSLKELSTASGGESMSLSASNSDKLPDFIRTFITETKFPNYAPAPLKLIDVKITNSNSEELSLSYNPSGPVHIKLTSSMSVEGVTVTHGAEELAMVKSNEWSEPMAQGRRITFSHIYNSPVKGETLTLSISCRSSATEEECRGFLVLYEEQEEQATFSMSVSTSAIDNIFDGRTATSNALHVYAMIQQNFEPLVRLNQFGKLSATATFCLEEKPTTCLAIPMTDNGAGVPDLIADDGILSGALVAPDGTYTFWVSVQYEYTEEEKINVDLWHNNRKNSMTSKAVDQNIFPCSLTPNADLTQNCIGTIPTKGFQTVAVFPQKIVVLNSSEKPRPRPTRIFDLEVEIVENSGTYSITLSWTAPSVFNNDGSIEKVETYEIKHCSSLEDLLENFNGCGEWIADDDLEPANPGERQIINIEVDVNEGDEFYFAVKSSFDGLDSSELSNVVKGTPTDYSTDPPIDPTETVSPTTEDDTSTTTEETTTEDNTSTTTDETTTEDGTSTTTNETTTEDDTSTTTEETTTEDNTSTTTDETTTEDDTSTTTNETTTEDNTSTTTDETTTENDPSTTTDETTTEDASTTTTDETTTEETTMDSPETEETTTEYTSTSTSTTEEATSTPDSTDTDYTDDTDVTPPQTLPTTSTSTTTPKPTTSPLPITETPEYFFKRTVGYITAALVGFVALGCLSAAVGYLFWKRRSLMMAAKSSNKHA